MRSFLFSCAMLCVFTFLPSHSVHARHHHCRANNEREDFLELLTGNGRPSRRAIRNFEAILINDGFVTTANLPGILISLGIGAGGSGSVGPQGPAGPQGPVGATGATGVGAFIVDTGNVLTFNFGALTVTTALGATVTPFVVAPDGTTTLGVPVTLVLGINPLASIVIANPEFGNYQVGTIASGVSVIQATVPIAVNVDNATTGVTTILPDLPINLSLLTSSTQETQNTVAYSHLVPPI